MKWRRCVAADIDVCDFTYDDDDGRASFSVARCINDVLLFVIESGSSSHRLDSYCNGKEMLCSSHKTLRAAKRRATANALSWLDARRKEVVDRTTGRKPLPRLEGGGKAVRAFSPGGSDSRRTAAEFPAERLLPKRGSSSATTARACLGRPFGAPGTRRAADDWRRS